MGGRGDRTTRQAKVNSTYTCMYYVKGCDLLYEEFKSWGSTSMRNATKKATMQKILREEKKKERKFQAISYMKDCNERIIGKV